MRKSPLRWQLGMAVLFGTACKIEAPQPPPAPTERVVVVQGRARASQDRSEQTSQLAEEASEEAEKALTLAEQAREERSQRE